LAQRVRFFNESVIRETTRWAQRHGAINLAQGMPDFDAPAEIRDAACRAIQEGYNQYAVTWGIQPLRQAIADKAQSFNRIPCTADENVTVCCGATECMMATMLAIIDPGDEVIVFQPFYENYGPDGIISGATPVWVHLRAPDWSFDPEELRRAFGPKTKAIIINTPNNPTGRVFTREELTFIAELCQEHDVIAIADEIYEHIIYDGLPHVSIASLPGMLDRTVTISGLSKTFSVTGWRLGYCIAPADLTLGIRRVHDFLTVGAPHPLQVAAAECLRGAETYFGKLAAEYEKRRSTFLPYLRQAGFTFTDPQGAYYVVVDVGRFGFDDDVAFVRWMIETVGVAAVPASCFFSPKELGRSKVRFMFAKKEPTLIEAGERILTIPKRLGL
jgi:aminotransferase